MNQAHSQRREMYAGQTTQIEAIFHSSHVTQKNFLNTTALCIHNEKQQEMLSFLTEEKQCIQPLVVSDLGITKLEHDKWQLSATVTYYLPRGNFAVKLMYDDREMVLDEIVIVKRPALKEKRGQKRLLATATTESNKKPTLAKSSSDSNTSAVTSVTQMVDITQI